jgi:hypothetical protein
MPTVAIIAGVKIQFYPDEHPPPHFHARIAEFVAQVRIEPVEVLRGSLPANKVRDVLDWAGQHQVELMRVWNDMAEGRKPGSIS